MTALIDAVESWLAGQSFWVQVPILLAVLVPICWAMAGLVDRVVERLLRRHTRRAAEQDAQLAARSGTSGPPTR